MLVLVAAVQQTALEFLQVSRRRDGQVLDHFVSFTRPGRPRLRGPSRRLLSRTSARRVSYRATNSPRPYEPGSRMPGGWVSRLPPVALAGRSTSVIRRRDSPVQKTHGQGIPEAHFPSVHTQGIPQQELGKHTAASAEHGSPSMGAGQASLPRAPASAFCASASPACVVSPMRPPSTALRFGLPQAAMEKVRQAPMARKARNLSRLTWVFYEPGWRVV
jgi:hypothetical protein